MRRSFSRLGVAMAAAIFSSLFPASLSAQSIWLDRRHDKIIAPEVLKPNFDERVMKSNTAFRSDMEDELLQSIYKTAPLDLKDYLLQWLTPIKRVDERMEEERFFPKRRQKFNDKIDFLHSNHPPQPDNMLSLSDGVQAAWVKHYASQNAPGIDRATAITVDGSGNVYVTGYSTRLPFGMDYLTAKYNAAGNQLWTARYDGGGQVDNLASAIAVDGAGNVYVTGKSFGSGTSWDYATIKYNASGVQHWVVRYNGQGNSDDVAHALAVDGAGNVYVTGESVGSGTSWDYATIKYNVSGVQQWVARYNGPGNGSDRANALAVDDGGNVYVTGGSVSETSYDYATIKYNPTGVQQWVARYNGPRNTYNYNAAHALAVDRVGNVYVTGISYGSGTSYDYATIKYNASGVQQWVARYNGPGNDSDEATALAVDDAGNVYVTGRSGEGSSSFYDYDFATIKYNASGVQQWVARYNGPRNLSDEANALAVDGSGNVYVTGESVGSGNDYVTIKYNAAGEQQWVARYNGPGDIIVFDAANALAVDGVGNVYVTGISYGSGTLADYATIKYNASGVQQWVVRYNGPGTSSAGATALTVDGAGNVYVTGISLASGTFLDYDYTTIKYNAAGEQQWVARYNGPGNSLDIANALMVDGVGNVYVTGTSYDSETSFDYAILKYNAAGEQQWVARYNGPENDFDEATALAVDGAGNVFVTGTSYGSGTLFESDYATIKYNASGELQWVARYNGPGNDSDRANALAVDGDGNVFVTGYSYGSGTSYDYATIKYNTAGERQWVARYNGPENYSDSGIALAVDGAGNVYVTGGSANSGIFLDFDYDYATIKYNAAGEQQWVARYNGSGNDFDVAHALAVDGAGNVYVTGESDGSGTSDDCATIKYNAAGEQQWVARGNADRANALAVDGDGNVYMIGEIFGSGTSKDYVTIKYNAAGVQQWGARYNGPGNDDDGASALAVDGAGNVFVTGTSSGAGWSIYTTIKYVQTPVAVKEKEPSKPNTYYLSQNYPNPFNPSTTIRYAIAKPGQVTLKVFNLAGQEIVTLVNENKSTGEYQIQWNPYNLPNGVYVYRLQAGSFVDTKKLILLK